MTVLENLILGRHRHHRSNLLSETFFLKSVQKQEIQSRNKAEEIIDFLDFTSLSGSTGHQFALWGAEDRGIRSGPWPWNPNSYCWMNPPRV